MQVPPAFEEGSAKLLTQSDIIKYLASHRSTSVALQVLSIEGTLNQRRTCSKVRWRSSRSASPATTATSRS